VCREALRLCAFSYSLAAVALIYLKLQGGYYKCPCTLILCSFLYGCCFFHFILHWRNKILKLTFETVITSSIFNALYHGDHESNQGWTCPKYGRCGITEMLCSFWNIQIEGTYMCSIYRDVVCRGLCVMILCESKSTPTQYAGFYKCLSHPKYCASSFPNTRCIWDVQDQGDCSHPVKGLCLDLSWEQLHMLVGSICTVHTVGFFLKADVIRKCTQDISAGGVVLPSCLLRLQGHLSRHRSTMTTSLW
jgi:hypothetical protein